MARRKKSSFFEDIIGLASMLPWWVGLLLATVTYIWLHHVAIQPLVSPPADLKHIDDVVLTQLWRTFAFYMQYIIPIAFVIGAVVSAYRQLSNNKPPAKNTTPVKPIKSNTVKAQNSGTVVECPICGAHMVRRTAKKGSQAGKAFWGCPQYPGCKGTREID